MTEPTSALTLPQVREQWEASAKMLDEAESRLSLLAASQEDRTRASRSIEDASRSLGALTETARDSVTALKAAHSSAADSLARMSGVLATSDLAAVSSGMTDLARQITIVSTTLSQVSDRLDRVEQRQADSEQSLSALFALLDRTTALEAERDRARANLNEMYAQIPGRIQSRVQGLLPG